MKPTTWERLINAVALAAVFAALSWILPMFYMSFMPASHFLAVQQLEVDASNDTIHDVNVTYESEGDYPTRAVIDLKRHTNSTQPDEVVKEWTAEGFVSSGESTATLTLELDAPPPPGVYYYEFDVTFYPGYNVERTFTHRSDGFPLNTSTNESSVRALGCC